jgi:YggT family protein
MGVLLANLFQLIFLLIKLFSWALILSCVFSMLFAFGVLDTRNRLVWNVGNFLNRITEPVLAPVRRILPNFGNIDLSPLVVLLLIRYLLSPLLVELYEQLASSSFGV